MGFRGILARLGPTTRHVGRLAPSPTGLIHQGTARTALAAWLDCRAHGGQLLLRIEDVDRTRCVPGAESDLIRDLRWLGLEWDGGPGPFLGPLPLRQSERSPLYEDALATLVRHGRVFPCTCTRKEIGSARYPGTCRARPRKDAASGSSGRVPAIRFRTEARDHVAFRDRLYGDFEERPHEAVGDFVVRRADGMWAYQLAVTVDDLHSGVTHVVRGSDLLPSTGRQVLLRRCLEPQAAPLNFLHVPVLLASNGKKLSKRDGARPVAELRDRGISPQVLVGALAASLGLVPPGTEATPEELIPVWDVRKLPNQDQILAHLPDGARLSEPPAG